jgi:hypothetical protein
LASWGETAGPSWDDTTPVDYGYSEIKKPPKWPLVVQLLILLFSSAIFLAAPSLFQTQKLAVTLIGYLLTPFFMVLFLAILRTKDLRDRSLPWYDRGLGKIYIKWSGRLCLVSFLLAVPILWRLAIEIVN